MDAPGISVVNGVVQSVSAKDYSQLHMKRE